MSAVLLEGVTVRFRGTTALSDVSTGFAADTITGLLGRNGAGKTTLMQLVTGHRVPTSGTVRVFGAAPFENDDVLPRICFVKESQRYPEHFRVVDAVTATSRLFPDWDAELAASLLADFDPPLRRPIKKLSRGMHSAVGIVVGLARGAARPRPRDLGFAAVVAAAPVLDRPAPRRAVTANGPRPCGRGPFGRAGISAR